MRLGVGPGLVAGLAVMSFAGCYLSHEIEDGSEPRGAVVSVDRDGGTGRRIVQLAAGDTYSCALYDTGELWCWGKARGLVEDGHADWVDIGPDGVRPPPARVPLPVAATFVAGGRGHVCAGASEGAVWCWGHNEDGQVGDGTRTNRVTPTEVRRARDTVVADAGSDATCTVDRDNWMTCWGSVDFPTGPEEWPHPITGLAVGDSHNCLLDAHGTVACWGASLGGLLGQPRETPSYEPLVVPDLAGVVKIEASSSHSCAVTRAGSVLCWGANENGQLGLPNEVRWRAEPYRVPGIDDAVTVDTHNNQSCVVRRSGAVLCWGFDPYGLGDEAGTLRSHEPVRAAGVDDATHVAIGTNHTCVATRRGTVECWGANFFGQTGNFGASTPTPVPGLP